MNVEGGSGRPAAGRSSIATLAEIVAATARSAPSDVALVGLDGDHRWDEVERRTRAIAATLRAHGLESGDRVAVARRKTHRSFESVHGILRAGGVVVPIDPQAPPSMMRAVVADAGAEMIIGDDITLGRLDPWSIPAFGRGRLVIGDDERPDPNPVMSWDVATSGDADLTTQVGEEDEAYVIYTSGSTGRPKGIVHTHASAMAYARRAIDEYTLSPTDRVAGMNPLHFDMSTLELYAAPLAASTVVVMSEPHLQFAAALTERSAQTDVTVWYTVPFLLRNVTARGGLDRRPLPALRAVLYGGEPYPAAALRELMELLPDTRFVNVYGPAELNACTHHHLDGASQVGDAVPIGRPWADVEVRVVDDDGDVAVGAQGELWVSAPTVMRGYAGLAELTAERLVPRPDGHSWYKTGDLVHRDRSGTLWFHGRVDHQIKVRGVRIELEAVENALTNAPGVLHAVAGPLGESGDATFVGAEIVLEPGVEPDDDALRSWCTDRLPSVAVPRRFRYRSEFPETASGKIDRRTVRRRMTDDDQDLEALR